MSAEKLSRRKFISQMASLFGASLFAGAEAVPTPEYLLLCEHNPLVGMVNLSVLPDCLYCHSPKETLSMSINFGATFDPESKDRVNRRTNQGNLWQYGSGLKEAIARGQEVSLVLDFPWHLDRKLISLDDWEKYVSSLASDYQGATFVMDNELDAPEKIFWRENPFLFASYYLSASSIIRKIAPGSKILFPAESYRGNGQVTRLMMEAIYHQSAEGRGLNNQPLVDGLAVHVYVRAGLIRQRLEQFNLKFPGQEKNLPLYIRELGKTEGIILTPEEHQSALIQGTAMALSCVPKEASYAVWHAAYVTEAADPAKHSLTYYTIKTVFCKRLLPLMLFGNWADCCTIRSFVKKRTE